MSLVQVFTRQVYGSFKTYPANDRAKRIAELVGAKTFSQEQLLKIGGLGFRIEYVSDPAALSVNLAALGS